MKRKKWSLYKFSSKVNYGNQEYVDARNEIFSFDKFFITILDRDFHQH